MRTLLFAGVAALFAGVAAMALLGIAETANAGILRMFSSPATYYP
jgi:hypothetical protein